MKKHYEPGSMGPKIPLEFAIATYKTQAALARDLDLTRSAVYLWRVAGHRYVPIPHSYLLVQLHPKVFGRFVPRAKVV